MRRVVVQVRLTEDELERLDTLAAERHETRSGVLRGALEPEALPPLSRTWALEQLQAAAMHGSVNAAVALERALRLADVPAPLQTGPITAEEFARSLRVVRGGR